jgi:glyoxylase-like metal-dependent hydrolase (beta-lactamase superfamily II)
MEIAAGVHSIGQRKGGRVHAFLLDTDGELTLVDTMYDTDARPVLAYLQRLGRPVTSIKRIVLTHGHRSHVGGLAVLKRISGATVYAHEWEADIVAGQRKAQAVTLKPMRPIRLYLPVWYPFQLGLALGLGRHPPCPVDELLADGDEIGPLQVVSAPGHTPGHLAFHWPERRVLLAGDAIATWPELSPGWRAFNLNRPEQARSLRRLADIEAEVVGVGHGEPITADAADRVHALAAGEI